MLITGRKREGFGGSTLKTVKEGLVIRPVRTIDEVFQYGLSKQPEALPQTIEQPITAKQRLSGNFSYGIRLRATKINWFKRRGFGPLIFYPDSNRLNLCNKFETDSSSVQVVNFEIICWFWT